MKSASVVKPRRTIMAGGVLLIAYAVFGVIDATTQRGSFGAFLASAILFFLAAILLALGFPRDPGIAGKSAVGKIALIAFGARPLIFLLLAQAPLTPESQSPRVYLQVILTVVFAAAGVTSGLLVARTRLLHGLACWALFIAAAIYAVLAVLSLLSVTEVAQFLSSVRPDLLIPVVFGLVGLVFLFQGALGPARRQ